MKTLKLVIPKGRLYDSVAGLLSECGVKIVDGERNYRPFSSDPEIEVKLMKPQNIPKLVELGSQDAAFTGLDWILETRAKVVELLDLEFDKVDLVAAIPERTNVKSLVRKKRVVVASEYENLAKSFLRKEGMDFVFMRTYGATEVFPPEDADLIVDNSATGTTLKQNGLKKIAVICSSSTRFVANRNALNDAWKKRKLNNLVTLMRSVLEARKRVFLEMNVSKKDLSRLVPVLPCMKSPTISPLYGEEGYAVKVAVLREEVPKLIPKIKALGARDILEFELKKVIP
ncbi:TPA: ATP phosphoribosyltransferase [Candidatus Micrarchaeota archaeon]|nr:ATP phosphoribosyltransferase [Candidatus Micrarchaeota archaeon]